MARRAPVAPAALLEIQHPDFPRGARVELVNLTVPADLNGAQPVATVKSRLTLSR